MGNYTRYKVHERSDYMFKPRQPKKPYTPNPSPTKTKKPKNPYRLEVEDEEEPRKRRKMPARRAEGQRPPVGSRVDVALGTNGCCRELGTLVLS